MGRTIKRILTFVLFSIILCLGICFRSIPLSADDNVAVNTEMSNVDIGDNENQSNDTKDKAPTDDTRTHVDEIHLKLDLILEDVKVNDIVRGTSKDNAYSIISMTPDFIYFNSNSNWQLRGEDGWFGIYTEERFKCGEYFYMITLSVDKDHMDYYYVDGNTKVYVNELQWKNSAYGWGHDEDDNFTSVSVSSPNITLKEGETEVEMLPQNIVMIDEKTFPDDVFRNYVHKFDQNSDGWLSNIEIEDVERIMITQTSLSDLKGIEYFTSLRQLFCYGNQISNIDVSNNTELELLSIYGNKIKKLDVTHNTKLSRLTCYDNMISSLKLGCLPELEWLQLTKNKVKKIDVSQCPKLKSLQIQTNPVKKLNLKNNKELETLWCYDCRLTALDISKNKKLKDLYCYGNRIKKLNTKKNKRLERIRCHNNDFKKLDLRKNKKISYIFCDPGIDLKYVGNPQLIRTRYKSNKWGNLIYS